MLNDVSEFVGQGVLVVATIAYDDVAAGGVSASAHLGRRGLGGAVVVDADIGEVCAEPGLQVGTRRVTHGAAAGAQHLVDGRALHSGLPGFVAAAGIVLVLLLRPGVA